MRRFQSSGRLATVACIAAVVGLSGCERTHVEARPDYLIGDAGTDASVDAGPDENVSLLTAIASAVVYQATCAACEPDAEPAAGPALTVNGHILIREPFTLALTVELYHDGRIRLRVAGQLAAELNVPDCLVPDTAESRTVELGRVNTRREFQDGAVRSILGYLLVEAIRACVTT